MPHKQSETDRDRHIGLTPSTVLSIISLMLVVICILAFVSRTHGRKQTQHPQLTNMQIEQQAYRAILSEMHTGIRLARWEDFLQQFPSGAYARAVRAQHIVLQTHETSAWAKYADTVYAIRARSQKKSAAYDRYIANWGTLIRTQQLEALSAAAGIKSTQNLSFKTTKSIYQSGKSATSLAGEPNKKPTSSRQAPRTVVKNLIQKNKISNQNIRVKTARSPIYPRKAKRRKINATVILSMDIDARGRVTHVKLVSIDAKRYKREFVRAARRAARRSRFYPEIRNHKPVKHAHYLRTYTFSAQK